MSTELCRIFAQDDLFCCIQGLFAEFDSVLPSICLNAQLLLANYSSMTKFLIDEDTSMTANPIVKQCYDFGQGRIIIFIC